MNKQTNRKTRTHFFTNFPCSVYYCIIFKKNLLSSMVLQSKNPNLNSKLLCKCGLEIGKYNFISIICLCCRFVHAVDSGDLLKFVQFDWCFLITKCLLFFFCKRKFAHLICIHKHFWSLSIFSFEYNKRKINWFIPNNMKFPRCMN